MFDPQSLKKTRLTFFFKSAWPHYPLESSRQWPVEGSLSYDTVLQLDGFCRRQRKWVDVPCVPLFLSARYARLTSSGHKVCPKGTDVGVKPSAPSCPLTLPLPLYSGLTIEHAEGQGSPPGRVASVSAEVQTTPVPTQPQTALVSIGTQTVKVEEVQTTKTKDETEDKKEDDDEKKQVSLIYPWEHM